MEDNTGNFTTMSDTHHTDSERASGESTSNVRRRHVLQGIGAAGVAGVVGTTQAQEQTPSDSSPLLQEGDDEIDIGTQFWTYNENSDKSTAELIREADSAGYDIVEPFAGYDNADAITTALEETDVSMGSAHVGVGQLEDNDELIQQFSDWGVSHLVHAFQGRDTFSSEDSITQFADRVNAVADRLAEEDIQYGYHNHNHEFETTIGDTPAYDVFAEKLNDNAHLQIDAGWVLVGGYDPIQYIQKYSDKVNAVHMKNMTADGDFTEIDEGDVNMRAVATVARNAANVDFLIYEYDAAPNPMESMQTGADVLEQLDSRPQFSGVCSIESDTHPALL